MEISASLSSISAFIDCEGSYWYCGGCEQGLAASTKFYKPFTLHSGIPQFTKCSSKYMHSLLLDEKQHVWSFGGNNHGELGTGTSAARGNLTEIDNLRGIRTLFAGYNNSFFISNEGDVYANGYNNHCELGYSQMNLNVPKRIEGIPPIQSVSAAQYHSLLLDCEGSVWSTGKNSCGELGVGDTEKKSQFSKIEGIPEIKSVFTGLNFSVLLDFDGYMWACGLLEIIAAEKNWLTPAIIPNLPKVAVVETGIDSVMFSDESGDTWALGNNTNKQLGISLEKATVPTKVEGLPAVVKSISQTHHTLFLDVNGTLLSCGKNTSGQLGLSFGDLAPRTKPEVVLDIPSVGFHRTQTKSARKVV